MACKCICGDDKGICIDCMQEYIEKLEEYIHFMDRHTAINIISPHVSRHEIVENFKRLKKEMDKFKK